MFLLLMRIDWANIFAEAWPVAGASEAEIAHLIEQIRAPLSPGEVAVINAGQRNPFRPGDPSQWVIPQRPLPQSYLGFLRFSNGGEFCNGGRRFQFFPALSPRHGLRAMLLAYGFPEYMPLVLPFALNGGGVFYTFDMREAAVNGEYPILVTEAGNLGYEDAKLLAASFVEACEGKMNIEELLRGET
jgi:hypothetical protein